MIRSEKPQQLIPLGDLSSSGEGDLVHLQEISNCLLYQLASTRAALRVGIGRKKDLGASSLAMRLIEPYTTEIWKW
jgi:hypothetical protein